MPLEPLLPADHEAEAALLGGLLSYPDHMDEVVETLVGDALNFDHDEHRVIYSAYLALWRAGEPLDLITVTDRLRQSGKLEEIGGGAFISSLATSCPTPSQVAVYARIVRSLARRRDDIRLMSNLVGEAYTCGSDEAYHILRRSVADALSDTAPASAEALPILTDTEAEALPALTGILGDVLFDESVSFLYGPSGRWKSFLALDWALSIATGRAWMGKPVVEGDVLYVCAEGARGIGKRITAWKMAHGVRGTTRLRILPVAIDLANTAQVAALPRRLEALEIMPRLIVFDTLAASNSGDEKEAVNANLITASARQIIRAHPGCCVLIVHHTGYDATHMRGSTAFFSNVETVIRIEGGDANRRIEPGEPIRVVSDKPKDGEPFADITLTAERQSWADETGAPHSSLTLVACDAEVARAARRTQTLTPARRQALTALEAAGANGLIAASWRSATGLAHSTFFNVVEWLTNAQLIHLDTALGVYVANSCSMKAHQVDI